MMTPVHISLNSLVLKLLLALALVAGVGLMIATPALAQVAGQYAPSTQRNVSDIDRLQSDEGEGSTSPTSSGRVPVVGTTSPEANPTSSSGRAPLTASGPEAGKAASSSGRAPLTASSPEAGKAEAAGKAKAGKAEAAGKAKAGRSAVQGVLPATGGPLLPVILLAGLALAGTGLLVLRSFGGRE